jgi:hypothetical protein
LGSGHGRHLMQIMRSPTAAESCSRQMPGLRYLYLGRAGRGQRARPGAAGGAAMPGCDRLVARATWAGPWSLVRSGRPMHGAPRGSGTRPDATPSRHVTHPASRLSPLSSLARIRSLTQTRACDRCQASHTLPSPSPRGSCPQSALQAPCMREQWILRHSLV